jgi:4-alpha-glucanotransferase
MSFPRAAGILLHPTSLPSRGGVGDFGPAAYRFVDFLTSARQSLWQVLPLGPLGYGNSPYSSTSAFAGNPLLISLERLAEHGWIDWAKIDPAQIDLVKTDPAMLAPASASGPVEYDHVFAKKVPLLFESARNFLRSASGEALRRFENFCSENAWWLQEFVLFDALRARRKLESWNLWPRDLAHREPAALEKARQELATDLQIRSALQFAFYEQWRALRRYCSERAIRVVGLDAPGIVPAEREFRAGSSGWSASRFFQQNRTALGESAIPLGCHETAWLRVVDSTAALGDPELRLHPARSFPRI